MAKRLCPICGERIELDGKTTDGRLIGSCGDAFPGPRQTSANNALLSWAKRQYNGKIYAKASEILNSPGHAAAIEYLCLFVRTAVRDHRASYLTELAYRGERPEATACSECERPVSEHGPQSGHLFVR